MSAHTTGPGDRPIVPRPAPPREIPRINPAVRQPTAPENAGLIGNRPRDFAGAMPYHQQLPGRSQSPLKSPFPTTTPSYGQPTFMPSPSMVNWQGTGQPSLDYNVSSEFVSPTSIVNTSGLDPLRYGFSWPSPGTGSALSATAPQSLTTDDSNLWRDDDDFDDDDISLATPKTDAEEGDLSHQRYGSTNKRQKKEAKGAASKLTAASSSTATLSQDNQESTGYKTSTLASTSSGSTTSSRPSKLRSASRTSKNTHLKPAETAEERRSRTSHNLVEKQYRNRLNNQFEALLNVLPEQVRSGGEGENSEPALDFADKRVSKAEVLDMARRYIKILERERDTLERERSNLYAIIENLRQRCGLPKYDGGMFGGDEDDDMAGGMSTSEQ